MEKGNLKIKIGKMFELAREQAAHHSVIESAKKLYNKQENPKEFLNNFLNVLKYALVYPDKNASDRMLLFVSKFASSLYAYKALAQDSDGLEEDLEHPFINGLFNFLFETHSASLVDVRLKCTTLINYILTALPDDSWLPVGIWNGLTETTRTRLQDRNANVRVAAVLVARKLQEPKDPKCEIVKLLSFHMTDPSPAVRRAVISSIALSKFTIVDVLARTLDVNENVRRNAFAVIAKVRFQSLSISQRVTLIDRGLKDRADRVKHCVETVMLSQWFDQVDKDIFKLIEGLDVVNCPQTVDLALKAITGLTTNEKLIEALPIDTNTGLLPFETLTPEQAFLWRFVVSYLKETQYEDLDALLPTVTAHTNYIKSWLSNESSCSLDITNDHEQWAEVKRKHIVLNLLEIAALLDFDEVGRITLRDFALNVLKNSEMGSQLVEVLVDIIHKTIPHTDTFLRTLLEVMSDLREPLNHVVVEISKEDRIKKKVEMTNLRVALGDLKDKEYEAVKNKDYNEAAKIISEIESLTSQLKDLSDEPSSTVSEVREEKKDPITLCKCLRILIKVISCCGMKTLNHDLKILRDDILIPCINTNDLLTQSLAIQALAQFCILDKDLAQEHLLTFLFMLSESGENEVNIPALKAVFDILHVHGTECFNDVDTFAGTYGDINNGENADDGPTAKCMFVLKELLNQSMNDELKRTAFEGFCKLLITGVIYSPSLLKTVIIKGFTPIRGSESEDRIRQIFMVFFPVFAHNTVGSQEMIEEAFIPVLRSLNDAKLGSPEADISIRDVINFLIDYTKPDINKHTNKTLHIHNNLAFSICHEILRDITLCSELGIDHDYLRGLLQLKLSYESESFSQQLLSLLTKIMQETYDGTSLRIIKQLQAKISDHCGDVQSVQNTLSTTQQSSSSASEKIWLDIRSSDSASLGPAFTSKVSLGSVPESVEDTIESAPATPREKSGNGQFVAESPEISSE